jgi:hypothetical protein
VIPDIFVNTNYGKLSSPYAPKTHRKPADKNQISNPLILPLFFRQWLTCSSASDISPSLYRRAEIAVVPPRKGHYPISDNPLKGA